jgi:hypothetical protein
MAKFASKIVNLLGENLNASGWADMANRNNNSPRATLKRVNMFKKAQQEFKNRQATRKAAPLPPTSSGLNTANVAREQSSFKRMWGRNPNSYIRSRRRRHGRPSVTPKSNGPAPVRYFPAPNAIAPTAPTAPLARTAVTRHQHRQRQQAAPGPQPRPGKFMRECRANSEQGGCVRHKTTHDCKFVHRDEPEWAMLRADQKKRGGSVPPLSSVNTHTSWPGGVDPTSALYSQAPKI